MRQIFGDIRWEAKAAVFLCLIAIFSVLGPFGSYETMTFAERFTYWTTVLTGIGFFMHVFMTMALQSHRIAKWPGVAKIAIGSIVAAIPGAAIVEFANEVFRPSGIEFSGLARTWMQVSIIGIVVGIVEYLDWRPTKLSPEPVLTQMHKRLPDALGTDIVSMSMQDHYIEVTTKLGSELILMRFTDALQEVQGLPGLRTHRSHWVALAHAQSISRKGNKHFVTLSDGRKLAVSATYLDPLQKALAEKP